MSDLGTTLADEAEPQFLASGAVDQLAGMVLTLGMELSVLARRIAVLNARLDSAGVGALDPETEAAIDRAAGAEADRLVQRVLANVMPDQGHARPLVEQQLRTSPQSDQ
jgi:hypothetical protein